MNDDLMKAILAMDSYNRSYNQGIQPTGNILGNYTIILDSSSLGFIEGSTTVRKDVDIGFYGIAYEYNGAVVISYRGTDELAGTQTIGSDAWNGYGVALGSSSGEQARLAFENQRGRSKLKMKKRGSSKTA